MQPQQQPDASDALEIVEDGADHRVRRAGARSARWKILVVDDDSEVHAATQFVLGHAKLVGRSLELISANSSLEAQDALLHNPDVAVILLDVVMEEHDSGLKFAQWVRESGLEDVRIILRTGQPGYAPELDVIRDYDINDYRAKSELTQTRLITSMTTALRSYQQIETIERSRRGLELIVASCSQLFQKRELASFSQGVLMQIASLCSVDGDGMICNAAPGGQPGDARIVSGLGRLAAFIGRSLGDLPLENELRRPAMDAMEHGASTTEGPIVVSVESSSDSRLVAALDHPERLDSMDSALLSVFAANIAVGFENVGLIERLDRLAFWDEAANLPNRNQLLKDAQSDQSAGHEVALVRLLTYTDTLVAFGQAAATSLVRAVAASLAADGGMRVFRYSEDIIAVVITPDSQQEGVLHRLGQQRFAVAGQMVRSRFAIGCASLGGENGAASVCDEAHAAMSLASAQGCESPVRFDAAIVHDARSRIEMMTDLREALEAGALSIAFQPIVEMASGACSGFEALARWQRDGESVSPAEFIPLADQAGLTLDIFALGVRKAAELVDACDPDTKPFYVSVNLCAGDLQRPDLVTYVVNLLARCGLPPARLQIEITEQSLIDDFAISERNLLALKGLGCRIAIDDFGTGYSSLAYIGRLPVHVLKLDRQFIINLNEDTSSQAIAGLTLDLANRLGLEIMAEGIETEVQQAALEKIGFRYAQGFRFGRPMAMQAAISWLEGRR